MSPQATRATQSSLPANHPLRCAQWIWPGGQLYLYNTFAQFRKEFDLARVPRQALFYITADQSYRLWVNGVFVCRGPARGYQHHWPFDEVDLAPFLRSGHNWIAVQGYNPGIGTFQYRHQSFAGMLCAGRWGSVSVVSDKSWVMRRDPSVATWTARYSLQLAFQEHVDCEQDSWKWVTDETCDLTDWANAPEHSISWDGCVQYGRAPYDTVEPRGIPNLESQIRVPTAIVGLSEGECAAGWRDWDNVSWPWVGEARRSNWRDDSALKLLVDTDRASVVLPETGGDHLRAITLEMGEYCVGNTIIGIEGACDNAVLDFHFYEATDGFRPALHDPGAACHVAIANRVRPCAGRCSHEFFHINGFRYMTVVVRNTSAPLRLHLAVRHFRYPFSMRGQCATSDTSLNAIVDSCRRTQRICSLDSYMDTPWREQAQWWGDARVQARNTFYMDGDPRLLARGIRSVAAQSTSAGLTFGHAPTIAYNCILPDFSLTWILTLRDYWWQTGDISLFREQWPRVQEVLGYFDTPEARDRSGLLRHDTRYWYFGDWAYLYKGEVPTLLNLWYLLTLRATAVMLRVARMPKPAATMASCARAHERLAMALLYDPKHRCFVGGLDSRGRKGTHVDSEGRRRAHLSVHDQTVALMLGLAPESHHHLLETFLLPYLDDQPSEGRGMPSSFWSTYVLEELGSRGYGAEVVEFIRRKWSPMIAGGTVWEHFHWHPGAGSSVSHAWSAHPASHLVNILAGIRQTAPGWKRVQIAPRFVPGVSSVSALVPSPAGDIAVAWERDGETVELVVTCPKTVTATLQAGGVRRVLSGSSRRGRLRLGAGLN
jgi:alpha-L-rhamnosidase